jgi:hypothetical protein
VFLVAASLSSGCNAVLGPSNVDHNWRAFDSGHFTLYVRPASFAEANQARLGEVLDDQYVTTLSILGVTYAGRISAFLYTDAGDAALESDHSGVAYASTESLRATCVPPLDGNLFALLQHEANHVIQRNTLGRPGTSFMNEGLPSAVLSTKFHEYGKDFLYSWTASHLSAIPPLTDLVDDDKWTGGEVAYKASASFLAYLLDRGGAEPIKSIYQAPSKEFGQKVHDLYGQSLDELERAWRAFCVAHGTR